jgi:hypothetical protein
LLIETDRHFGRSALRRAAKRGIDTCLLFAPRRRYDHLLLAGVKLYECPAVPVIAGR